MVVVQVEPAASADRTSSLREAVRRRLEVGNLVLPMLPQVASQVVAAAGDPNTDAGKLSALIHRDPALAGHVLKIANSPAYQPRMPIVSLQQAVARLGLATLTEIALAASIQSGVFKVPGFERELAQLWKLSLAAGTWAKEVARARRFSVESAFLSGLLHAIGRPVVLQATAEEHRAAKGEPPVPVVRGMLPGLLDELHAAAGLLLGKKWELPSSVMAAIEHYRTPAEAGPFVNDAATAALADALAGNLVDPDTHPLAVVRKHPCFELLNFYQDEIDALCSKAETVRKTVDALVV